MKASNGKLPEKEDRFVLYFRSDLHNKRVEDARGRAFMRLANIGKEDLLAGMSEAIGTLFGVGLFYRSLGLKHQASQVFMEVYRWLKSGTD